MKPRLIAAISTTAMAPLTLMLVVALMVPLMTASLSGGIHQGATGGASTTECTDTAAVSEATPAGTTESDMGGNVRKVAQALADAGVSKAAAAGVMGNIKAESEFNPRSVNSIGATGLVQWYPGSKIGVWAKHNGMGNRSILDMDVQLAMLINQEVKTATDWIPASKHDRFLKTNDPKEAADLWFSGFERAGDSSGPARQKYAQQYYDGPVLAGLKFKAVSSVSGSAGSSSSGDAQPASCESSGSTVYGKVGDAPLTYPNFSWMCKSMGVCKAGDIGHYDYYFGNGYQCTWYTWTRLAMIHGTKGWTTGKPNHFKPPWEGPASMIPGHLKTMKGWEVDDTPHPGDGLAGWAWKWGSVNGHIVTVEEVKPSPDGYRVRVSEGNWGHGSGPCYNGTGCWTSYVGNRWITKSEVQSGAAKFFRFKAWNN